MSLKIDEAEAEDIIARTEEIEADKEAKKLEREQRRLEKELKKKREFQEKLVAPILLIVSIIVSVIFLALRS